MTQNRGAFGPGGGGAAAQRPARDVAKDEAVNVGNSAREAGSHVAQSATDQAKQVVSETGAQARDLLGEAKGQVRHQAATQQHKAAQQLRAVAGELSEMAAKGGQSGPATKLAQEAAQRVRGVASWLDRREPGDLLDGVRDFARRHPGQFLAGAAVAGVVAGRLTRGLTGAAGPDGQHRPYPPALSASRSRALSASCRWAMTRRRWPIRDRPCPETMSPARPRAGRPANGPQAATTRVVAPRRTGQGGHDQPRPRHARGAC